MIIRLKYFHDDLNTVVIIALGREFYSAKCAQVLLTFTRRNKTMDIFPLELLLIKFWDKAYQETNFKSLPNNVILCVCFLSFLILLACAHFGDKIERCQLLKLLKYLSILQSIINNLKFKWRNAWLCLISIVWVHFSHKTEKFRFRILFDKKNISIFFN